MGEHFDRLARATAGSTTRRGALARIGAGLGAAVAAAAFPAAASARRCPEGETSCGGAGCCPEGYTCCKIKGAHYCCPTGRLITIGCPGTLSGAVNVGCLAV